MPEAMKKLSKEALAAKRLRRKSMLVEAAPDDPIYSSGWQVGSAPAFRVSTVTSQPNETDKENQPHPGLVLPIDPNAIEELELRNPDGSD